jgi:ClpP class serine protease
MIALIPDNRIAELVNAMAMPATGDAVPKVVFASEIYYKDEQSKDKKKKGVITISGALTRTCWYRNGYEDYIEQIDKYINDADVVEIELQVDSPGGVANGAFMLAYKVAEAAKKKPVRAYINDGDMLSAAYLIAAGATEIVASKSSDLVGCIGAANEFMVDAGYLKNLGVKPVRLVSDSNPEKGIEYEEAKKGNVESLKNIMVNPVGLEFTNFVRAMRPQVNEDALKGRIYTAQEGLTLGLIDRIDFYVKRENPAPVAEDTRDVVLNSFIPTNANMLNKLSSGLISLMAYFGFSGENVNEKGLVEMSADQLADWKSKLEGAKEATAALTDAQAKVSALSTELAAKDDQIARLQEQVAVRGGQPVAVQSDVVASSSDEDGKNQLNYVLK